ncbi:MAG: hypothetical protein SFV23_04160 [Planctomycetaceae bacterium]|nr:hypothetical protein [Planctomycetaceae bacterium]
MPAAQLTHAEVLEKLPAVVADCLAIEEADVTPEANFRLDLGGESIDDIDLSFRCDRAFGLHQPLQALGGLLKLPTNSDGTVSLETALKACERIPYFQERLSRLGKSEVTPRDLLELYTIEGIAHVIAAASNGDAAA